MNNNGLVLSDVKMKGFENEKKLPPNGFEQSFNGKPEIKKKPSQNVMTSTIFYESYDSVNITTTVVGGEIVKHDGSDSGVEMNGKCNCNEQDADGHFVNSSNSSIVSGHSSSPCCADIDDLIVSASNLQISTDLHEYQLPTCSVGDGNSENGSESSSVSGSRKCCRPSCINLKKSFCSTRSSSVNGRKPPPSHCPGQYNNTSPTPKHHDVYNSYKCPPISNSSVGSKIKNFENRSRATGRSLSSSRCSSGNWPMDGRISVRSKPCSPISNNSDSENKSSSGQEKFVTLPRRQKNHESRISSTSREPSLNRAASLRKKYVENNLMTTSLILPPSSSVAGSSCGGGGSNMKSPIYYNNNNRIPSKTKIYHETSVQTLLTHKDLEKLSAGFKVKSPNANEVQMEDFSSQVDLELDKVYANKYKNLNEELKKMKEEFDKQKTVIQWMESELTFNKNEKFKLQNQLSSMESRLKVLIRHGDCGTKDTLTQLEREVKYSDEVMAKQQKEIDEMQEMCCVIKQDLEKSYCTQRSLVETQKANELESMELQEFLQAEKSMLNDSLRDTELQLNTVKTQLNNIEQELVEKTEQCSHLVRISEQQRQENLLLHTRLTSVEHRSKDLLLQQGAAISSASVALSGLASRFELLLEQILNAYNVSYTDLQESFSSKNPEKKMVENQKSADDERNNSKNYQKFISALTNILQIATTQRYSMTSDSDKKNLPIITTGNLKICNFDEYDSYSSTPYLLKTNISAANLSRALSKSSLTANDESLDSENSFLKRNSLPMNFNDELLETSGCSSNGKTEFNISESLNNLSEAILTRQNVQSIDDSFFKEYIVKPDISLVDQVIDIDNIISKLLKTIKFIQLSFDAEISDGKPEFDHLETNNLQDEVSSDGSNTNSQISSPLHSSGSRSELMLKLQRQHGVVNRVIMMLNDFKNSEVNKSDLQKIREELESINASCDSEMPSHYSSFSSSSDK